MRSAVTARGPLPPQLLPGRLAPRGFPRPDREHWVEIACAGRAPWTSPPLQFEPGAVLDLGPIALEAAASLVVSIDVAPAVCRRGVRIYAGNALDRARQAHV